ncbi:MAG: hypothetical protein K6U75_05785 [Firmicutes bacterium]|nr:hypothetical protein [Bacillota bacterium]
MATQPKYRVELFWDLDMDVHRTSKIVTGLVELARQQKILLEPRVGMTCKETGRPQGHIFAWMVAERLSDHQRLNIAIDLHDLSTLFYEEALRECDVYLKKSFYPPDVEKCAGDMGRKVIPFGFNMPCSSTSSKLLVQHWLLRLYSRMFLRSPQEALTHWRRKWGLYRTFLDGPTLKDFEQTPDVPVEPKVVFQTRVWSEKEVGPDNHLAVNSLRVEVMRRLRAELGDQFVGGLVPTAYAREHYPDVLSSAPARRQKFIRWSKRYLVGVYVRGLNYSYGFRFAEHLAASQCVVAHPEGFRNPAPVQPQEGVHYLPFATPEECVKQCKRVLDDTELAQAMRNANYQYYQQQVAPAAHLWNCLERGREYYASL